MSSFSFLLTMDEQLIGVICIMMGFGLICFFYSKKKTYGTNIRICLEILVFYFVFYFTWGRWLCQHFTPGGLIAHTHNYRKLISIPMYILPGIKLYYNALLRFAWNNIFILGLFLLFFVLLIWRLWVDKNYCVILHSIYFIISGYIFSLIIVTEHPTLIGLKTHPKGMYYCISVALYFLAYVCAISQQNMNRNYIPMFASVFLIFNTVYIQLNIREYALTHMMDDTIFYDLDISTMLQHKNMINHGIDSSFFGGLIITENDYMDYLQSNDISVPYHTSEKILYNY